MTIENSTISSNRAGWGGGIASSQTLILNNSTVSGNRANKSRFDNVGGGVWLDGNNIPNSFTINNSTIIGNQTLDESRDGGSKGGGIYFTRANLTVTGSIVSGNSVASGGAGSEVYSRTLSPASDVDSNYNLFGHSGLTSAEAFTNFNTTPGDITATFDAGNLNFASILDSTLADNGGPTLTHALVPGSPAIDFIPDSTPRGRAVLAATCDPGTSHDQRGVFRANGTTTGSNCDIGAFEFGAAPTAVTVASFNAQTVWGGGPQLIWQTADESNLSGFHIWRGSAEGAETRLTDTLIGATGGLNGREYNWQDSVSFSWGERTSYWLEAVHVDGSSAFTGPVEVLGIGRLFLPRVGR